MINYLPFYERQSKIFSELLNVYDKEFGRIEQDLSMIERNAISDTAIEKLYIYERDLGIKSIENLSYEQRREQISSRFIASFDQTTEKTIKSVAQAYTNGRVEVLSTDITGLFEIKFIDEKGAPNNFEGLKEALDTIIPAHLEIIYVFIYNTWEEFADKTWGDIVEMTWEELRTWDEVI